MGRENHFWACLVCLALGAALSVFPFPAAGGLNPQLPGLPAVDNVYGLSGIPNNNVSATCVSCHTVAPLTGRTTHFVHQQGRNTSAQDRAAKERTQPWTGSGRASKYGNFTLTPPVSDNASTGELICESCHNLKRNVGGGNNLLETSLPANPRPSQPNSLTSATTTLCEGCHTAGTLSPLLGVPGHHPMTGDMIGTTGTVLSTAGSAATHTRAYAGPSTEMGSAGSEVRYPAPNALPCLSCHGNGHDGYTGTGARIMNKGDSRDPARLHTGVAGVDNTRMDRQFDVDPAPNPANRLITNYTPLCDACHTTNDP